MKLRYIGNAIRSIMPRMLIAIMVICSVFVSSAPAQAATWPTYQYGSSGVDVRSIELLLNARGFPVEVDGKFGTVTKSAVIKFQRSRGLAADGIVGPMTWEKLIITLKRDNSGYSVRALQWQLIANSCSGVEVNGYFGPYTDSAVRRFQSANGLVSDGIVGPMTWNRLVRGGSCAIASRVELARYIRDSSRVSLYTIQVSGVNDGADARSNIVATANGGMAKRSSYGTAPGGHTYLQVSMLKGMKAASASYTIRVTSIAGGSHSSGSAHYYGRAFDVDRINGVAVSSSNPYFRGLMNSCWASGASLVLGPGNAGHSSHVHCQWSN